MLATSVSTLANAPTIKALFLISRQPFQFRTARQYAIILLPAVPVRKRFSDMSRGIY